MKNHPHPALVWRSFLARSLSLRTSAFTLALLLSLSSPTAHCAAPAEQLAEAALMPFLDVLTSPPAGNAKAFHLRCRLESLGTQQYPQDALPSFEFALQPPGRLLFKIRLAETEFTACRDGQTAWVAPSAPLRPFLDETTGSGSRKQFPSMQLPFSGKQLGMLPVLLDVQDKGSVALEGVGCQVLDVRIRPEISRLLPPEASEWALRLWLNGEGKPVRAGVRMPNNSLVLRVDQVEFTTALPANLWKAPEGAQQLSPEDFEKVATRLLRPGK